MHTQPNNMRLIEHQMCRAVQHRINWSKDNTQVMYSPSREVSCVYLHGNLIATIDKYQVEVYDGGWRTNTTKSRLNALINELCDGYNQGIYQHQFEWFIHDDNEGMQRSHAAGNIHQDIPFEHGYTFSRVN
tara:strand:+ start:963 stop:1355 length:393 start_codon:yes stop_codon:yes gene_type:complete